MFRGNDVTKACNALRFSWYPVLFCRPKFSVIIVKKRISARLFNKGDGVNLTNPPPGTVVDTDITRKDW